MRFSVVGAGGWGTAIARLLAKNEHETLLWDRDPKRARAIEETRENAGYLPGVRLPKENLRVTTDLSAALAADAVFLAVPSFGMDAVLTHIASLVSSDSASLFVNLAKGLDPATRRTMSGCTPRRLSVLLSRLDLEPACLKSCPLTSYWNRSIELSASMPSKM